MRKYLKRGLSSHELPVRLPQQVAEVPLSSAGNIAIVGKDGSRWGNSGLGNDAINPSRRAGTFELTQISPMLCIPCLAWGCGHKVLSSPLVRGKSCLKPISQDHEELVRAQQMPKKINSLCSRFHSRLQSLRLYLRRQGHFPDTEPAHS